MTSISEHALTAHGLYKRFKTGRTHIEVLKRVGFDALHGDVTMVMGPSGSGKSTLVATLSGLLKPDEGQVTAMGQQPQLLFADEPTSALDGENGQVVIKLIQRAAKSHGAAVICVTHDPRLEAYADRIIHLEDGHILSDHRVDRSAPAPEPHAL